MGLMLYQQERSPQEVYTYFARAGASLTQMHLVRRREVEEERRPRDFATTVHLVVCFGAAEYRRTLSQVQSWQYCMPRNPDDEALVGYLEMLQAYIAGAGLDQQMATRIEQHCLEDTAPQADRVFLLPKVRGLQAVQRRDADTWELALSDLVKAHAHEAQRGQYRLLPEGFICVSALMLTKLGEEAGMMCHITSPYLPLHLLEVQR